MSALEADRLRRVALAVVGGEPGNAQLLDHVTQLGAEAVHAQLLEHPEHGPRLAAVKPECDLEAASRRGLRFVIPGDDEWPAALDDLAEVPALGPHGGVPVGLWVRGPLRLDALAESVAVVGSRAATTYGDELARELGIELGRQGRVVVSGAAYGIDQAAHRGAIAAGAPTVAVLACGADRVYPQRHRELIEHLGAEAAVISETVPGGAPMRMRFLARNRLIAALTGGTVVVEAALRSGALNTANWADRLNRVVMGVPGPVTSASSVGVHQLIRSGAATLVTSGAEVLELVGTSGEYLLEVPRGPDRARDALTDLQRMVLDAVPVARGATSMSIARVIGVETGQVHTVLLTLEVRGLVLADESGWRLAALAHD